MKPTVNGTVTLEHLLAGLGPALFSSIRAPFGIFDRHCRIVWINKSMAFIHRCDQQAAVGKRCREALRGCQRMCKHCPLKDAIALGRTQVAENWIDVPGGGRRWGEVQAYPVRDQARNVSAVIVLVFETTDSKRALEHQKNYTALLERQLQRSRSGAEDTERMEGTAGPTVNLTRRESDVLRLVTEGYTNVQIAEVLSISAHTVKSHVNSLFNKLGVNDRTQAAVLAARNRLV